MLIVLSPSKTLDETKIQPQISVTEPYFKSEVAELISTLQAKKVADLQKLMGVSNKIAELNYERFQNFSAQFSLDNSKPALFSFKGDVYSNMEVQNYNEEELEFAQDHLLILSGLYGLLKPLDLIQPYRLEMGTGLKNKYGKNLYEFWGDKISQVINHNPNSDTVINLASQEYFKSVKPELLRGRVIHVSFKNNHNGKFKTIGLLAKRARGMMANYIIKNQITDSNLLKDFRDGGYKYRDDLSSSNELVFVAG